MTGVKAVIVTPTWCLICEDRPAEGTLQVVYRDTGRQAPRDTSAVRPVACSYHGLMVHGAAADPVDDRECEIRYVSFRERGRRRRRKR